MAWARYICNFFRLWLWGEWPVWGKTSNPFYPASGSIGGRTARPPDMLGSWGKYMKLKKLPTTNVCIGSW